MLNKITDLESELCEFQMFALKFIEQLYSVNDVVDHESKLDQSPVTQADIAFSKWLQDKLCDKKTKVHFLSEEEDSHLHFPSYILDPIDGTKAFIEKKPECVVSLGFMNTQRLDDPLNWAWVWNPLSGYLSKSLSKKTFRVLKTSQNLRGFISTTDFKKGLFSSLDSSLISVYPISSIAFKLALLADGACDFVISLTPKNIWDIAAGSVLCAQRGLSLFNSNGEVQELSTLKFEGPLLWCNNKDYSKIWKTFKQSGFNEF